MKRTPLKRKPAKRRAPGTACPGGKRCLALPGRGYCALHLADKLFGERVRASLGGRCWTPTPRCQGEVQCAHILSRRYRSIRWSDDNARPLCAGHHLFFTLRPADWEQFCRDSGIDWDDLRHRALNDPPESPLHALERLER